MNGGVNLFNILQLVCAFFFYSPSLSFCYCFFTRNTVHIDSSLDFYVVIVFSPFICVCFVTTSNEMVNQFAPLFRAHTERQREKERQAHTQRIMRKQTKSQQIYLITRKKIYLQMKHKTEIKRVTVFYNCQLAKS